MQVYGDVNQDALVSATGDVLIWGRLRGDAAAGTLLGHSMVCKRLVYLCLYTLYPDHGVIHILFKFQHLVQQFRKSPHFDRSRILAFYLRERLSSIVGVFADTLMVS